MGRLRAGNLISVLIALAFLSGTVYGRTSYTENSDVQFDTGSYTATFRLGSGNDVKIGLSYFGRTSGLIPPDSGAWFNPSWKYRRIITVNSSNASNLVDYRIPVVLNTQSLISAGRMKTDGSDLRFTGLSSQGTTTYLDHCVESGMDTGSTLLWIRLPSIAPSTATLLHMYYGNQAAADVSGMSKTFIMGDDFTGTNGSNPSNTTWLNIQSGTPISGSARTIQNNSLDITFGSPSGLRFFGLRSLSQYSFSSGRRFHFKVEAKAIGTNAYSCITLCPTMAFYSNAEEDWVRFSVTHSLDGPTYAVQKRVGGGSVTDIVPSAAVAPGFHDVEFLVDATNLRVHLDGVEIYSGANNLTYAYIYLEAASARASLDGYTFDTVFVTPLASPEPSVADIGTEQGMYYSSGTYISKVIDSGAPDTRTEKVDWASIIASNTALSVDVRSHNADIGQSAFAAVARGADPGLSGRYLQYRVNFSETDPRYTAYLSSVTLDYTSPPPAASGFSGEVLSTTSLRWSWADTSSGQYQEDGNTLRDTGNNPRASLAADTTYWIETGLTANTQYTRYIQAYNVAGSSNSQNASRFTLPVEPRVTCNRTAGTWYPQGTAFLFTNQAGFGINGVAYYRYVWTSSSTYTGWSDTETSWNSGTLSLSPSSSTVYYLHVKSFNGDGVANSTVTYGPYDYDAEQPSLDGFSPSSASWNNTGVSVQVSLSDTGGSRLQGVRHRWSTLVEKPSLWSSWDTSIGDADAYTVTMSTQGEGELYLHVECRDNAGNSEYSYGGPYRIDTASPAGSIAINNGSFYTPQREVTLFLSYQDAASGVKEVRYRNNTGTWSVPDLAQATTPWVLTDGEELKTVEYEVKDTAGNYAVYSDSITLDSRTTLTAQNSTHRASGNMGEDPEVFTAEATLTYTPTGSPIAGTTVQFVFEGSTETVATDSFGVARSTFAAPVLSGTYTFAVTFSSDGVYASSNDNGTLTVTRRPTLLAAEDVSTTANSDFTAKASLIDLYSGQKIVGSTITFVFDGSTQTALTNGAGVAAVTYTASGSTDVYSFSASFEGDATYAPKNASGDVGVGLRITALVLSNVTPVARSTFTVQATLMDGSLTVSTKTISFVFMGSTKTADTNAVGIATVAFVAPSSSGTFQYSASFAGDEVYYQSSGQGDVLVTPRPVSLVPDNDAAGYVNAAFETWAVLSDGITGEKIAGKPLVFIFEGSSRTVSTDGAGVSSTTFSAGSLARATTCYYSFSGDGEYEPAGSSAPVTINKRPSSMTAFDATVMAYSTFTASIQLDDIAFAAVGISSKTITFNFMDQIKTAQTNAVGVASVTYQSDISTGIYNFTASFTVDDTYLGTNDTGTVTVSLRPSIVSAYPRYVFTLDSIQTVADLKDGVTGELIGGATMSFTYDGTIQSTTTTPEGALKGRAYAVFTGTPVAGTYNYAADFSGDAVYAAKSSTASVVVSQRPTTLSAYPVEVTWGNAFTVTGELKDGNNGTAVGNKTIRFVFQSTETYATTNGVGIASATFSAPSSTGTFSYLATFAGDSTYVSATSSATLTVSKRSAVLTALPATKPALDAPFFSATFADAGTPVSGKTLYFYFRGSTISVPTDGTGTAVAGPFAALSSSGTYAYSVSFPGDSSYVSLTSTSALTVEQRDTTINLSDAATIANSTFTLTATFLDVDRGVGISTKTLTFIFQGSTTTRTATANANGIASAVFTAPGSTNTYTYSATFGGDGTYAFYSSTANVTVTVRPTALDSSDVSSAANSTFTVTATLRDTSTGVVLSTKAVSFVFYGSTRTVLTSALGIATTAYVAPSSTGTYSFSATFAGDSLYQGSGLTKNVYIGRRDTTLQTSDILSAVALDTFTVTAKLKDFVQGYMIAGASVSFTFSGSTETAKIGVTDSSGVAKAVYLAPVSTGSYFYSAVFSATSLYNGSNNTSLVAVNRRSVIVNPHDLSSISARSSFTVTADLLDAGTNLSISTRTLTFNFQTIYKDATTNNVGAATTTFVAPSSTGTFTYAVSFGGDALYNPGSGSANIIVTRRPTMINVVPVADAVVGLSFQGQALLSDFETGELIATRTVTFTFSTSIANALSNSMGVATTTYIAPSSTGSYVYSASFVGDGLYSQSQSTASVTVKLRPTIFSLTGTEIFAKQLFGASGTLKDGITGENLPAKSVSFVFQGATQTVLTGSIQNIGIATATFTAPTSSGIYTYNGYFYGDNTYEPNAANASVNVKRRPTITIAGSPWDAWERTLSSMEVYAKLVDGLDSNPDTNIIPNQQLAYLYMNSTQTATTNSSGIAYTVFPATSVAGDYPYTVTYNGDATYEPSYGNGVAHVERRDTRIEWPIGGIDTYALSSFEAKPRLYDRNGDVYIADKSVQITFQGEVKVSTSDAGGVALATFTAPGAVGSYQVRGDFSTDYTYYGSWSTSSVNVGLRSTTLLPVPDVLSVGAGSSFRAQAKLVDSITGQGVAGSGNQKSIEFIFRGTTITATTDISNGIAAADFTAPLTIDTYTFTARFYGDVAYGASNTTGTVVVEKNNTILSGDNVTSVPAGNSFVARATLNAINGTAQNPIAEKTVNFVFLSTGVPLNASNLTDSLGVATTAFYAPLTTGTYRFEASFSEDVQYKAASDTMNVVNVVRRTTALTTQSPGSYIYLGDSFGVTALLTDQDAGGAGIGDKSVLFQLHQSPLPDATTTVTTNTSGPDIGKATTTFSAPASSGTYSFVATFGGDALYTLSSDTKTVTVIRRVSSLVADPVLSAVANSSFTVKATLSDITPTLEVSTSITNISIKFVFYDGSQYITAYSSTGADGVAIATFTAPANSGSYNYTATFPGDTTYGSSSDSDNGVIVRKRTTTVSGSDVSTTVGVTFSAIADLIDEEGKKLSGKLITITFNSTSTITDSANTDGNGRATVSFSAPLTTGTYNYTAYFAGDTTYEPSNTSQNPIVVNVGSTTIVTHDVTVLVNTTFISSATLTGKMSGQGIPDKDITFVYADTPIPGSHLTNINGVAISPITPTSTGTYRLDVSFDGDDSFYASSASGTITVLSHATTLGLNDVAAKVSAVFVATATLRDVSVVPSSAVTGRLIRFNMNGVDEKTAYTNAIGVATVTYTAPGTAGTYSLDAFFDGDSLYLGSTGSSSLAVSKYDTGILLTNVTVSAVEVFKATATLIDSNGSSLGGKTIHFSYKGASSDVVTGAGGIAPVEFNAGASSGPWRLDASFDGSGDSAYNSSSASGTVTVLRRNCYVVPLNVTATVMDVFLSTATLYDAGASTPVTGKVVSFGFDTSTITASSNDVGIATAAFTAPDVSGIYQLRAFFTGDVTYNPSSVSTSTVLVDKRNSAVVLKDTSGMIDKVFTTTATVTYPLDGSLLAGKNVRFVIDGSTFVFTTGSSGPSLGIAVATFTITSSTGAHRIDATFDGDASYYASNTASATVTVQMRPTFLVPVNASVLVNNVFTATATLKDSDLLTVATRTVSFVFQGSTFAATTDKFGVARATFTASVSTGTYQLGVAFAGDFKYTGSTTTLNVSVLSRPTMILSSNVTANALDVFSATATLRDSDALNVSTKTVRFVFVGSTSTATTNTDGVAVSTFTAPVSSGTYVISIFFDGDVNYNASSTAIQTSVLTRPTTMSAESVTVRALDVFIATATLTDVADLSAKISGRPVTFAFSWTASSITAATNDIGIATAPFTAPASSGVYQLSGIFRGDVTYSAVSATRTITVTRRDSKVLSQDVSCRVMDVFIATATFYDAISSATVSGQKISFLFGNSTFTAFTNSVGVATVPYSAPASSGTYLIKSWCDGDATYNPSALSTSTVTLIRRNSAMIVSSPATVINSTFTVSATLRDGLSQVTVSSRAVAFVFQGSTVIATTDNFGVARATYAAQVSSGTYEIGASFAGDASYDLTSASNSVAVLRRPASLSAQYMSGIINEIFTATATLRDAYTTAAISNKDISFVFQGSTMVSRSDTYGVATATFVASVSSGTYQIGISFGEGDTLYAGTSTIGTADILRRPASLAVSAITVRVLDVFTATATLKDALNPGANISGTDIRFDFVYGGSTFTQTDATNGSGIAVSTFTAPVVSGPYQLRASFDGSSLYSPTSAIGSVTVTKRPVNLILEDVSSRIDEVFVSTATLVDSDTSLPISTKTIVFTFGLSSSTVTNASGKATAAFTSPSSSGAFVLNAAFSEDVSYLSDSATSTLTVQRRPTALAAPNVSATIDEIFVASATLVDILNQSSIISGATVSFIFDESTFTVTTSGGVAVSTFTAPSSSGTYRLDVVFTGDARYMLSAASATVAVGRRPSAVKVDDLTVRAMEVFTATATLTDPLGSLPIDGRTVSFVFDGSTFTATTSGGVAVSTFTAPSSSGTYRLDITFGGDGRYLSGASTGAVTVLRRELDIIVRDASVNALDVFAATSTLVDHLNAGIIVSNRAVSFVFEGSTVTSLSSVENIAVSTFTAPVSSGTYPLSAIFAGDSLYEAKSASTSVTVLARATQMSLEAVSVYAFEQFKATATLTDTATSNPVGGRILRFDLALSMSTPQNPTNAAGVSTVTFTAADTAGLYQVQSTFDGDATYTSSNATATVTVLRRPTSLAALNTVATAMDVFVATITLQDSRFSTPISGRDVVVVFEGASSTATTNIDGAVFASFSAPAVSGTYYCSVFFNEDDTYSLTTTTGEVRVVTRDTRFIIKDTTANTNEPFTLSAQLLDPGKESTSDYYVKSVSIEFKVKSKTGDVLDVGTASTNDVGIATITFTGPSVPDVYYYTARFAGNYTYSPSSATAMIRVGILTSLVAFNVETYTLKDFNASAKLTDYLSTTLNEKLLRFVFLDQSATAYTGASGSPGIATCSFTAPASSGTYFYNAFFDGDSFYSASNATATVVVNRRPTSLLKYNVTAVANSSFTVTATLMDLVDSVGIDQKTIDFTFNGTTVTCPSDPSGDASATFFAALSSGAYVYAARFNGDNTYMDSSVTGTINVELRPTTLITYDVVDAVASSTFTAKVLLKDNDNNTLQDKAIRFTFLSSTGTATTNSSGWAECTFIAPSSSGAYVYGATFAGDSQYTASSASGTVTIGQRPTMIFASNVSANAGYPFIIEATLVDSVGQTGIADRALTFIFMGSTQTAATNSLGISTVSFQAPASTGAYTYTASFLDSDATYLPSVSTATVVIGNEVTVLEARDGISLRIYESLNVDATLKNGIGLQLTGMPVTFTFQGQDVTDTTDEVGKATATFATLGLLASTGTYNYTARFPGDTIYLASSDTSNVVNVLRRETNLNAMNTQTVPNKTFMVQARLYDNVNGSLLFGQPVTDKPVIFDFFDGNSTQTVTGITYTQGNSTVSFSAPGSTGTYTFSARFDGDSIYGESVSLGLVYVLLDDGAGFVDTAIEVAGVNTWVNQIFTATATLTSTGIPVYGKTLLFEYFNGVSTYTRVGTTDEYGVATSTFAAPASSGTYLCTASFAGDGTYSASRNTGLVAVSRRPTLLIANDVLVSAGDVFTATATLSAAQTAAPLDGKSVRFEFFAGTTTYIVHGVTDAFGIATATFVAAGFSGASTYIAVFEGDTTYDRSFASASVMVIPKATQAFLVIDDARAGINEVFMTTATLTNKGRPVPNKEIKFVFENAINFALTNETGIATMTFTAPLSTGAYIYSASFAGDADYNASAVSATVTVIQTLYLNDPSHIVISSANANEVSLSWPEVTDQREKIKGYRIERNNSLKGAWAGIGFVYSTATALSYAEPVLKDIRYYRVRTVSWDQQESKGIVIVELPEEGQQGISETNHIYMSSDGDAWVKVPDTLMSEIFQSPKSTAPLQLEVAKEDNAKFLLTFSVNVKDVQNRPVEDFVFKGNRKGIKISFSYEQLSRKGLALAPSSNRQMAIYWYNGVEWVRLGGVNDILSKECYVYSQKLGKFSIALAPLVEGFTVTKVAPRIFTPEETSTIINRARFYFENPDNHEVTIRIFDLTGALVRRNLEREGDNIMSWDGTDNDGAIVNGGIYVYQIEAGKKIISGTVVVAK